MEEKLQKILNNYEEKLQRQEKIVRTLESKIDFCTQHKLDEERRITLVRWETLNMAIYRWRKMHNELREMLNAWQS
jgi:heme-degrading monooxygenase HmoA